MSPTTKRYEKNFPTPCNFSATALEEALQYIGPAFVYLVRCHSADIVWMRNTVKKLNADIAGNPLSPLITLEVDSSYAREEWSVHANGMSMGSEGC